MEGKGSVFSVEIRFLFNDVPEIEKINLVIALKVQFNFRTLLVLRVHSTAFFFMN